MTVEWLTRALEESRARGFLGPNSLEPHLAHAEGFAITWNALRSSQPEQFLDLGSGGGLPGLVLLERWDNFGVLLDSMHKRVALLNEVLTWPGAPENGRAVLGRAEEVAREPGYEGKFDLVTSRAFGPPSVTAECAVRFLKEGGLLIVSEPPESDSSKRWESPALKTLGMTPLGFFRFETGYQVLEKSTKTPKMYPRTNGIPRKTPLF